MIKIDYDKNKLQENNFINQYISEIITAQQRKNFNQLNLKNIFFKKESIDDIISYKFTELLNIKERIEKELWDCKDEELINSLKKKVSGNNTKDSEEKKKNKSEISTKLKSISIIQNKSLKDFNFIEKEQKIIMSIIFESFENIFNYTSLQPKISKFFEKNINPTTCYFCNIDFINVFNINENIKTYSNKLDFFNNASQEELQQHFTDNISNKIIQKRNYKNLDDVITNVKSQGFNSSETFREFDHNAIIKTGNGFTLDHVIDKGTHPYFALSLFNLVPSCYICNSKLKGSKSVGGVSPTDTTEQFDFHEKVKFKTYFATNNSKLQIQNQDDIEVFLRDYEEKYKDYIEVFRLNERYRFHRYRVIEMIDKRKRYPDSRIQELAQLTGQTPMQVKKDLFGEYLYDDDLSKRPLSKLTRDIAEELGLI